MRLATIFKTDKWNSHWYAQHYQTHFNALRRKKLNILEIGVGGYDNPMGGANSLLMWKYFFSRAHVFSIDIYDKSALQEHRIQIFRGSQSDEVFLRRMVAEIGTLDIIVDDGSHINQHVIKSFEVLFPLLNNGGWYVVEDTQTSYWADEFDGDSDDLNNPKTMMNYFKRLTDSLNHKEFIRPGYVPSYFDQHIVAMHFYHNMVFIHKGHNNEESNMIKNNRHWKVASSQP